LIRLSIAIVTRRKPLSKLYVETLLPDQPPYQVDDQTYKRFDQRNNLTVGRPNWDESVQTFSRKAGATRVAHIKSGRPGYDLKDYSLFLSGGVTAWSLETRINHANRGLTSFFVRWCDCMESGNPHQSRQSGTDLVELARSQAADNR
jgi:hypothetical protein